ncbi:hypothetical protein LPJ59_002034 [Coemansia sp. RSA 2399]|nr:hypothetical protein LPJ59_002034 [Coemansia sp. RSA 2399]
MRRHAKLHGDLAPRSRRKGRNITSCHPYEERLIHMQVHTPHMFPPMHGFRFGPPPVLYVQPSDSNLLPPGAHGMVPTQPISTGGIIGPLANAMDLPQPSPLAVSHPYPSWDNLVFRRLSAPAMPPPQVPWP